MPLQKLLDIPVMDYTESQKKQILDEHRIHHSWYASLLAGDELHDSSTGELITEEVVKGQHNLIVKKMLQLEFKHHIRGELDLYLDNAPLESTLEESLNEVQGLNLKQVRLLGIEAKKDILERLDLMLNAASKVKDIRLQEKAKLVIAAKKALFGDIEKAASIPDYFVWIPDFVSISGSVVYNINREPRDLDIIIKADNDFSVLPNRSLRLKIDRICSEVLSCSFVEWGPKS